MSAGESPSNPADTHFLSTKKRAVSNSSLLVYSDRECFSYCLNNVKWPKNWRSISSTSITYQ